jgi:hypothetical protein
MFWDCFGVYCGVLFGEENIIIKVKTMRKTCCFLYLTDTIPQSVLVKKIRLGFLI